ncbi:hypothetical protein AAVH_17043 [Aphelenchoides avenae]|nr:hypothetical protein AAVH_17043 [Aphelenchus avenae]
MSKVLFQWVDGGILRQFQLEKNTVPYRILMAVVNEVKHSLEEEAAATAPIIPASNEVHAQQADRSSLPPRVVSPLTASVNRATETPAASRAPRKQPARSESPTRTSTPGRKTASTQQWAFCDNCKVNGGKSQHICGTRFKCAVCDNFDLCEACEASGVHAHHVMLRIGVVVKHVVSWSSRALKPLHNELKNFCANLTPALLNPSDGNQDKNVCDECHVQLTGDRLKCTVCDDFDLCSACDKKDVHKHHVIMRFSEPVKKVGPWKDMQGSSILHAQLRALHNRVVAVKERPTVGRSRPKRVSDTFEDSKLQSAGAAGTQACRFPYCRHDAPKVGSNFGFQLSASRCVASERTSTQRSRGVRSNNAASAVGESGQPLKSEEPTDGQTEANHSAAAFSPPLKAETSEGSEIGTAMP